MPFIVNNAENAREFVSQLAMRQENSEAKENELDRYIRFLGYEINRQKDAKNPNKFYINHLSLLMGHATRLNQEVKAAVDTLGKGSEKEARKHLQTAVQSANQMFGQLLNIQMAYDENLRRAADDILRSNLTAPMEREMEPPWKKYAVLGGYYQEPEMPEELRDAGEIYEDMEDHEIMAAYGKRREQWKWILDNSIGTDLAACNHEQMVDLAARAVAAKILHDGNPPQRYSQRYFKKAVEAVKQRRSFQIMTKDDSTISGYLSNEANVEKLRNISFGLYVDGTAQERQNVNSALDSLGTAMRTIIPEKRRSEEWKNFHDAISGYTHELVDQRGNPARPGTPGAQGRYGKLRSPYLVGDRKEDGTVFSEADRINEVFDSIERYIKGKKSLRSNPEEQARFDLAMDALAIVSKTSPAAALRADAIVQRINHVRTHRPWFQKAQPPIDLNDYGREHGRERIRQKLIRDGRSEEMARVMVPTAEGRNTQQQPVQKQNEKVPEPQAEDVNVQQQPGQNEKVPEPQAEDVNVQQQPVQKQDEKVPEPPAEDVNVQQQPGQDGTVPEHPAEDVNVQQPGQNEKVPEPQAEDVNVQQQPGQELPERREIVEAGELTKIYPEKPDNISEYAVSTIYQSLSRTFKKVLKADEPDAKILMKAFAKALALDRAQLYHSTDRNGNDIAVLDADQFKAEAERQSQEAHEMDALTEMIFDNEELTAKVFLNEEGEPREPQEIPGLIWELKKLLPAAKEQARQKQLAEEQERQKLREQEQMKIMNYPELPQEVRKPITVKSAQNKLLKEIASLEDPENNESSEEMEEAKIGKILSRTLALTKCTLYRTKAKNGNDVSVINSDELDTIAQSISEEPDFKSFAKEFVEDQSQIMELLVDEDGEALPFEAFAGALKEGYEKYREQLAEEREEERQRQLEAEEESEYGQEQEELDSQDAEPKAGQEPEEEAEPLIASQVLNADMAKKLPVKADLRKPVEVVEVQSDLKSSLISFHGRDQEKNAVARALALSMLSAYRQEAKNGRAVAVVDGEELEETTYKVLHSPAFSELSRRLKEDQQYAESIVADHELMKQMGAAVTIMMSAPRLTARLVEEYHSYEKLLGEKEPAAEAGAEEKALTALELNSAEQILSLPEGNAESVTKLEDLRQEATRFCDALYGDRVDFVYKDEINAAPHKDPWKLTEDKLARLLAMGEVTLERKTINGQICAVADNEKLQRRADEIKQSKQFQAMSERMKADRHYLEKLGRDNLSIGQRADLDTFYKNVKRSYDESLRLADERGKEIIEQRRRDNLEKWNAARERWQRQEAPELPEGPMKLVPLNHDGIPLPPENGPRPVPNQIAPGVFAPRPDMIPEKPIDIVRASVYEYDPEQVPAERLPVKKLSNAVPVKATVLTLNSMSKKFSKGESLRAFDKDPVNLAAKALALKGMTVYRGQREDGKTVAVVDGALLKKRMAALEKSPVVQAMAKDMAENPEFRKKLTAEIREFPDAERLVDAIAEEYRVRVIEHRAMENDSLVKEGKALTAARYSPDTMKPEDLPQRKIKNPVRFDGTLVSYKYHAMKMARGEYPKQLMKNPVEQVAKVLALSQLAVQQCKMDGKPTPVVDGDILMKKMERFRTDPAVEKLAEKMADPKFRETLAAGKDPEGRTVPVSGTQLMENICSRYGAISKQIEAENALKAEQEAQRKAQKEQEEAAKAQQRAKNENAQKDESVENDIQRHSAVNLSTAFQL